MSHSQDRRPVASSPAWPIGSVLFCVAMAACFIWYAADVALKARGATDWMMIVPAAALGVVALLACIAEDLLANRRAVAEDVAPKDGKDDGQPDRPLRSIAFMVLLAIYVGCIPFAGFDLATFVFLAASMVVQGERIWWRCLGFSALVTVPVVYIFVNLLQVPLHTLVL